jgi:hypothetical protein
MSGAVVDGVEPLGVEEVEAVHPARQAKPRGLDDEVVMVGQKAITVTDPFELPTGRGVDVEERPVVQVVKEDRRARNSSSSDVKETVWEPRAWAARHESIVECENAGTPKRATSAQICHIAATRDCPSVGTVP